MITLYILLTLLGFSAGFTSTTGGAATTANPNAFVCGPGSTNGGTMEVGIGDSINFKTQQGPQILPGVKCKVLFECAAGTTTTGVSTTGTTGTTGTAGTGTSTTTAGTTTAPYIPPPPPLMAFTCDQFDIINCDFPPCKKQPFLEVNKKKHCNSNPIEVAFGVKLSVSFQSKKKNLIYDEGMGADCSAQCIQLGSDIGNVVYEAYQNSYWKWNGECSSGIDADAEVTHIINNTPMTCQKVCTQMGKRFSAVGSSSDYPEGSACFCQNNPPMLSSQMSPSMCYTPCPGDSTQICGGSYYSNVIDSLQPGCYKVRGFRKEETSESNDKAFCDSVCRNKLYPWSARKGEDCYCGHKLKGKSSIACDIPCPGNPDDFCGGRKLMNVDPTGLDLAVLSYFEGDNGGTTSTSTTYSTSDWMGK